MSTGSCLCGTVRWQVHGPLRPLNHCHCSMCRKAHGASFVTFTGCAVEEFEWLGGQENVGEFSVSPALIRGFCRTCGSSVPGQVPDQGRVFLPAGPFDDDPGVRPNRHTFVADKAPWVLINDDLAQHDAYPKGSDSADLPVFDRAVAGQARAKAVRGSCLCGQVAFEVSGAFKVIHNCHCSRCRKARAAAHATNGFAPLEALTFTRGEDQVAEFKLPGAKAFGQAFCRNCGSGMPRCNTVLGVYNVPFGSLDDDPGQIPNDHIFVGSMAPWHKITDDLPQFAEMPG